jgi:hypothetical protein
MTKFSGNEDTFFTFIEVHGSEEVPKGKGNAPFIRNI